MSADNCGLAFPEKTIMALEDTMNSRVYRRKKTALRQFLGNLRATLS